MEVLEVPEPPGARPGRGLVHPDAVGICGSDFHFFAGELQIFEGSPYPADPGPRVHGDDRAARAGASGRLSVGDRVAILPISYCGECYPCRVGRGNVCDKFSLIGIHTDGGLQEQPRGPRVPGLPDRRAISPPIAALAEPVSIAVRSHPPGRGSRRGARGDSRRRADRPGMNLLARERGATTLLVDRVQSRLDLGRRDRRRGLVWEDRDQVVEACREWSGGEGPPLVIDATGAPDPIRAAVDMVASAGRVTVVGMSGEEVPLRIGTFTEKEIDMLGVSCCGSEEFEEAVRFVENNREAARAPDQPRGSRWIRRRKPSGTPWTIPAR